jgi:AraC-like DNA-binding protein
LIASVVTSEKTRFERQQVAVLFDRCQVLAGRFGELSPSAVISEMNELVAQLPASLNRAEQVTIGGVFGHFLAHVVREAGIDGLPDVTRAFLNLADAGPTIEGWRLQWFHTTRCCTAVLPHQADTHELQIIDIRVTRMLRLIHTRYADSSLTMRQVAQMVNLSPSHAARMFKQQTGCGFRTHLHRCRILLVRRLLVESRLSIKEIAAAAGYAHASQLSRHFKIACGETPLAFRTARSRPLCA